MLVDRGDQPRQRQAWRGPERERQGQRQRDREKAKGRSGGRETVRQRN